MSESLNNTLMTALKERFAGFKIWNDIETDLAIIISDLPPVITEEKKPRLLEGIGKIRKYLLEKGVLEEDVLFLDDEFDRYKNTKQISLHLENEDWVDPEEIKKWATHALGSEGIIGMNKQYTYDQLKRITNGVYQMTGLVKFYISQESKLVGKITAEMYEHPQKIPIASLMQSKKEDELGNLDMRICFFGERPDNVKYAKVKDIEAIFHVYRFISEDNKEYIVLSTDEHEVGEYNLTGVVTECSDLKALTESQRLPTKIPFMFLHTAKNRIIKYGDHQDFQNRLNYLNYEKDRLFEHPFTLEVLDKATNEKRQVITKHPRWFKQLIWSWLLHHEKGMFNPYPFHLLILGQPGGGKSVLLNCLHSKTGESRAIYSGVSSTLKGLVPSFKEKPPKVGYMAETNRFAFLDEFFRAMIKAQNNDQFGVDESVGIMNDLLEHQSREAGSGVSRLKNVNMTARALATSNPVRGTHTMHDLLKKTDHSFLSRWLILFQSDEHLKMIQRSDDSRLKENKYSLSNEDFISMIDYLQSFPARYDMNEVNRIKNSVLPLLAADVRDHYDARHLHHLEALLDGIVKTRCLLNKSSVFKARAEDYAVLEVVWKNIIRSWIDYHDVHKLEVKERIFYLPEVAQDLWALLSTVTKPLTRLEAEDLALTTMSKIEFTHGMVILLEYDIFTQHEEYLWPYFLERGD